MYLKVRYTDMYFICFPEEEEVIYKLGSHQWEKKITSLAFRLFLTI